ncbi:DNA-directed RNA polymerase subunit beta [Tepidibacillus infernus]|uniref:DNA-directed RNA polymerase subunit beta n=1 Tax=Tepidibacillus infernus TaxID=1806172 RepID=UPI003B6BBBD1
MESQQAKVRSRSERHTTEKKKKKTVGSKQSLNRLAFLLIAFAIISFFVGSIIGYGVLGKGNPLEILNPTTWVHMYQLIFG